MTINSEQADDNRHPNGRTPPFSADLLSVAKETNEADNLKKKKIDRNDRKSRYFKSWKKEKSKSQVQDVIEKNILKEEPLDESEVSEFLSVDLDNEEDINR